MVARRGDIGPEAGGADTGVEVRQTALPPSRRRDPDVPGFRWCGAAVPAFVVGGFGSRPPLPQKVAANTLFRLVSFAADAIVMLPIPAAACWAFLIWTGHTGDFMDGDLGLVGVAIRITLALMFVAFAILGATVYRLLAHPTTGRTLGERLMGVQCVAESGGKPSWAMSAKRAVIPAVLAVFVLLPPTSLAAGFASQFLDSVSPGLPAIVELALRATVLALILLPLVGLLFANYRGVRLRADRRTLMDRMSGTVVVGTVPEAEI